MLQGAPCNRGSSHNYVFTQIVGVFKVSGNRIHLKIVFHSTHALPDPPTPPPDRCILYKFSQTNRPHESFQGYPCQQMRCYFFIFTSFSFLFTNRNFLIKTPKNRPSIISLSTLPSVDGQKRPKFGAKSHSFYLKMGSSSKKIATESPGRGKETPEALPLVGRFDR